MFKLPKSNCKQTISKDEMLALWIAIGACLIAALA